MSHRSWPALQSFLRSKARRALKAEQGTPSRGFFWFSTKESGHLAGLASFAIGVAIWHAVSVLVANPTIVPSPLTALDALWSLATWRLVVNILITMRRVAIAFGFAAAVGIGIGLIAGLFPSVGKFILPVNSALRYIPPTAFISLTIVWFGVYESSKVALIFIGVVFYILQMTVDVVRTFPRRLAEAALNLGATRLEMIERVIFPYITPELLAILRVNMGAAWTFVVVAEVVSAQDGLGNMMAVSQRFLATPNLFALLFVVGFLGYLTDSAFGAAIQYSRRWK